MMPSATGYRLGVDIGGTFTDVVLLAEDGTLRTRKVLSTPDDYARGVIDGILEALTGARIDADEVTSVVHATTVASNTVLEGRGARTALVTTEGFRDVLEMRRLRIPVIYDLQYEKPPPLVPRRRRYEIRERMGPRGETWRPLDPESVSAVAQALRDDQVEAIAIALLNAYASSEHEEETAALLRNVVGDEVFITCSSEILPEIREYERTSTVVVNAYVGPGVSRYLNSLTSKLREAGIHASLEIMQSGGGTMSPVTAAARPAYLVESGPAAGVIACGQLARATGRPNLISFDMGGTTAKAAMLEDGEPVKTSEYEIGGGINLSSRLVKGGGYAIKLPFIDVSEIGAGGGSIIGLDELGGARVGPESAGAEPGPVSYGRGGSKPTLADALIVLGYLNTQQLAGGAVTLDLEAARTALRERVAEPLGLTVPDAAYGILMVAVATMTRAVKAVSTYRGRDPRDFALCAFGGNGPVVGSEIARALGMRQVIVPPAPGVFSAVGLLFSPTEQEFVRTLLLRTRDADTAALENAYHALADEAVSSLERDGITASTASLTRLADLRYVGQAYELTVPVPEGSIDRERIVHNFVSEHERTYGHSSFEDPIELVSIRIRARVERDSAATSLLTSRNGQPETLGPRTAYFGNEFGELDVPVIPRGALTAAGLEGPLFIDEYDSTTVIPPGCRVTLDQFGSISIDVD
jgi:N-methylhydantoinase A